MLSKQRRVVITGGSSGIGLGIVKKFLHKGDAVFNLDVQSGTEGNFIRCDVTDHAQVAKAFKEISAQGSIDALICNAGAHLSANIEETSERTLLDLFNLNVKGAFSATQCCLPLMKTCGGSIVYISSDQAFIAKPNSFAYNLTKHALASMAKTTAIDYAKYNIRANALCPGTTDTPLYQRAIARYCEKSGEQPAKIHALEAAEQPLGRLGSVDEVAAFTYFLCSEDASFVTGSLQLMDGGYCVR